MKQIETKKTPKKPQYFCEKCEFSTSNKKDFNRHTLTSKHQCETNLKQNNPELPQKTPKFKCNCNYTCNSRTSLWRHKQTCHYTSEDNNNSIEKDEEPSDKQLIMMLIKENSELKNMVLDVCQKIQPITNTVNSHNVNSNNKTFNLNVFLNETCKDAMNITDFVDSLKLQLSDLENVGEIGYVNGISNIIVKNLNLLEENKRPIHCADKKREVLYIKDEDKWEKDEEKKKIRKIIKKVACKNQRLLPEFKKEHPDCGKYHSKYSDQYNKLVVESMGGSGDNDLEKEDKIIRNIAKEVTIDKNIY
jgi:hypothetical protein